MTRPYNQNMKLTDKSEFGEYYNWAIDETNGKFLRDIGCRILRQKGAMPIGGKNRFALL